MKLNQITIGCLLIPVFGVFSEVGYADETSRTRLEQFKSFLEHPPIIKRLVAEQKFPYETNTSLKVPAGFVPPVKFASIKWQTNAFYFRNFSSEAEALNREPSVNTNLILLYSYYETNWWTVFSPNRHLTYWEQDGPPETLNSATGPMQSGLQEAGKFLNFGIEHSVPGSVRWNGSSFTCTNPYTKARISGQIRTNAGNEILGLDLELFFRDSREIERRAIWQLDYTFDSAAIYPYCPTKVARYHLPTEGKKELLDWLIYKDLEISDDLLPQQEFDPRNQGFADSMRFAVVGTNVFYKNSQGKFARVLSPNDPSLYSTPIRKRASRFYLLGALALLPAGFLLIAITKGLKKNK